MLGVEACGLDPVPPLEGDDATTASSSSSPLTSSTEPGATGQIPPSTGGADESTTTVGPGSDDEADDRSFIDDPDQGEQLPQCIVEQQDCPAGHKCVWYVEPPSTRRRNDAQCIPVEGNIEPYAPCTLPNGIGPEITDDCGADSFCLEVYGTADHGFCVPFAAPDGDCSDHPGSRLAVENGSSFPWACMYYDCNPLVPDWCPEDMRCTLYPAYLYGVNTCWEVPPSVDQPLGSTCDFAGCGEGKLCMPSEFLPGCAGDRCCTQWCDLMAPSCDDPRTVCTFFQVWSDDDPSFDSLGACLLPEA